MLAVDRPADILLVEDNNAYAWSIEQKLEEAGVVNSIHRVCNGLEALEFVGRAGRGDNHPPHGLSLILLDINMPKMDGMDVLRVLRSVPRQKHIPIIMLTSSDAAEDVKQCYRLGCNAYVLKASLHNAFVPLIRSFVETVCLPESENTGACARLRPDAADRGLYPVSGEDQIFDCTSVIANSSEAARLSHCLR